MKDARSARDGPGRHDNNLRQPAVALRLIARGHHGSANSRLFGERPQFFELNDDVLPRAVRCAACGVVAGYGRPAR
jgi:hypothetical protein